MSSTNFKVAQLSDAEVVMEQPVSVLNFSINYRLCLLVDGKLLSLQCVRTSKVTPMPRVDKSMGKKVHGLFQSRLEASNLRQRSLVGPGTYPMGHLLH